MRVEVAPAQGVQRRIEPAPYVDVVASTDGGNGDAPPKKYAPAAAPVSFHKKS
jgi:hypothetical protein